MDALLAVVEASVRGKHKPVLSRLLDHLRRPDHAATGIIAAEHRHDHPIVRSDILKPAEDAGRNVDQITFLQHNLAIAAVSTPEETPPARQHEEHLGGSMGMKRVPAFRRLSRSADIEPRGVGNMHMLVGTFRHAAADDSEVFLLVAAGRVRVDKGGAAGNKIAVANNALT